MIDPEFADKFVDHDVFDDNEDSYASDSASINEVLLPNQVFHPYHYKRHASLKRRKEKKTQIFQKDLPMHILCFATRLEIK